MTWLSAVSFQLSALVIENRGRIARKKNTGVRIQNEGTAISRQLSAISFYSKADRRLLIAKS
jgi:hypothetical protein